MQHIQVPPSNVVLVRVSLLVEHLVSYLDSAFLSVVCKVLNVLLELVFKEVRKLRGLVQHFRCLLQLLRADLDHQRPMCWEAAVSYVFSSGWEPMS